MLRLLIIGCLAIALGLCAVARAEEIRVEGGGAACAAVFYPLKAPYEDLTGDTLLVKSSTPVEGLLALEKGVVDIATAAVPLKDLLNEVEKEGVKIDPATLTSSVIYQTSTKVFIHKPSTVDTLSKEQLKGIFTGKITNWRELGDQDLPIDVIWGRRTPGQNSLFSKRILDGEPVTATATLATDYGKIRELVLKRPGAIGIDPQGFVIGGVKVPTTPLLHSSIIVITKGPPSPKAKKVLSFITAALADLKSQQQDLKEWD